MPCTALCNLIKGKGLFLIKLLYGVGIYEKGEYLSWVNGKMTKGYRRWSSMLKRCYNENWKRSSPTYAGCTVSNEFKSFQSFMKWAVNQVGFDSDNFQLDKDILIKGNKEYSVSSCCFVPGIINMAVIKSCSTLPQGVNYESLRGSYRATVGMYGKPVQIGRYDTPEEAFCGYKYFKEAYVKQLALDYKSELDTRVFETLLNYEV